MADQAHKQNNISWRGRIRLAAVIGNTLMVLYIYIAHLVDLQWQHFGRLRMPGDGQSRRLWHYVRAWDLEPAFELLRLLTFSDAMLENLHVYLIVGTPVAAMLFVLERDRISWLQALVEVRLPKVEAGNVAWWLDVYFRTLSLMLIFILSIAPFHLEKPRAHYFCASCALLCGCLTMSAYYMATGHLERALASGGAEDKDLAAWYARVRRWQRPALKCMIALHAACIAVAVLKAECLDDDRLALLFGVLETAIILSYQIFQAVFVVDDDVVTRGAPPSVSLSHKASKALLSEAKALPSERMMGS